MKTLLINRSDVEGGAARGATRLLEGLCTEGVDARLLVQRKTVDSPDISGPPAARGRAVSFARRVLESTFSGLLFKKTQGLFSPSLLPDRLAPSISAFAPDVIHLHWVARMMRLETIGHFKGPVVWTLHDSWPFTGGCFLPGDCKRYRESCGTCPIINSSRQADLSHKVWKRKQKSWKNLNLTIIAPSRWMGECAKASSLFCDTRIEVIPNGLDTSIFKPTDKQRAREALSFPQDKKLVLFGAKSATQDRNKGFHLLVESLRHLAASKWRDKVELVIFGATDKGPQPDLGFKSHYMGWQSVDSSLALLYAAADVFVLPSIQENLPYAAMESMACGTPCVAFRQGGVPDLIDHEQNGYLAHPYSPEDLTRGIFWIFEDSERQRELATRSRQKVVQEFALERIAEKHMALYSELLKQDHDTTSPK